MYNNDDDKPFNVDCIVFNKLYLINFSGNFFLSNIYLIGILEFSGLRISNSQG